MNGSSANYRPPNVGKKGSVVKRFVLKRVALSLSPVVRFNAELTYSAKKDEQLVPFTFPSNLVCAFR